MDPFRTYVAKPENVDCFSECYSGFCKQFREAVRRRVAHHRRVSVLFSGGLDSTIIAAVA